VNRAEKSRGVINPKESIKEALENNRSLNAEEEMANAQQDLVKSQNG